MRGTVLVCLLAVNVVNAASAEAECAMPAPAMFPEAETVPPNPVIYRFELEFAAASPLRIVGSDGRAIAHTASVIGSRSYTRVTEIHVAATSGTFTVRGGDYDVPKTYRIAPSTKPHVAPVVESVSWVEAAWTCSHTLGLVIDARGADVAAFRVVWSDGYQEIVPANDTAFWSNMMGGERDPNALRAFLGHPNCVANLIDDSYIGRRDFSMFALYADGTELEVELTREPPPVRPERAAQPRVEGPTLVLVGLMTLAGIATLSTLVLAFRRRRRTTLVP
jgi:hypothetical protein